MNYRNKANLTLTAVFIVFVTLAFAKHFYPGSFVVHMLYFMFEAALIGGVADWFAVTALFKRPLGFAYHTALIPRNRDKVIDAVGRIVEEELLGVEMLSNQIDKLDLVAGFTDHLQNSPATKNYLLDLLAKQIAAVVQSIKPDQVAEYLDAAMRRKIAGIDVNRLGEKLGNLAVEFHLYERLLDYGLEKLQVELAKPAVWQLIYDFLQAQKLVQTKQSMWKSLLSGILESTDSLNLEEATDAVQQELLTMLREWREPAYPLRIKFSKDLQQRFVNICSRQEVRKVFSDFSWHQNLENVVSSLINVLIEPGSSGDSLIVELLKEQAENAWNSFRQNSDLQDEIEDRLKNVVKRVVLTEHHLIGDIARETLQSFSNEDLNGFVENKAGNDLQWIRINGSIIGAAVGLLLFLLQTFIYNNFLTLPVLQHILSTGKLDSLIRPR